MAEPKLSDYRRKRDFKKTPEPAGGAASGQTNLFVVHKHGASSLHYDLRLQVGDVLKSWAVPKGPSLDPREKRLAVEVEDHPLDYADFEGVIPEGEYGGGPILLWDRGEWAPMGDIAESLRSGNFKFRLAGEKLRGGWMLARLKPRPGEQQPSWLLFKERDPAADTATDILETRPESIKSGLLLEELRPPQRSAAKAAAPRPGRLPGAVKAPLPERVAPQLATPATAPPEGEGWLHEIKFDGYRTLAHVADGAVRFVTRAGLDWSRKYGHLAEAFASLPCRQAVIDGEVVVVDAAGVSHFSDLQQALSEGRSEALTFFAFDLVHLDGWDLQAVPLRQRKQLLAELLAQRRDPHPALHYSDHIEDDAGGLFEKAAEMGLEGVVSKRAGSPYVQARTPTWLKAKALKTGDFPIVGYTTSAAAGGLAALSVGEWEDGELHYRGKVGTGFGAEDLRSIEARLGALRSEEPALDRAPKEILRVRPVLTAHVHYAGRTRDNSLRHAVFKGLREPELRSSAPVERQRLISDADLASIWVTNPTRRLFGKSGPSKLDVAVYYAMVGDFMLPHLFGRPVSLVRSPTGKSGDIFFQRHPFAGMPASITSFEARSSEPKSPEAKGFEGGVRKYIAIDDAKGYLALAQFGVIEFHTWGCRYRTLEKPDRVTFDLDPGEGVSWRNIVAAAEEVRQRLEAMGLSAFVKTSGGKGLHVVVPLKPRLGWKQVHAATGDIAGRIAAANPDTFVTNMAKERRSRRIFIDFHRNYRGATAAAPYSLRARTNLPASVPVNWNDLGSIDAPDDLNYSTLPEFLAKSGDPWASIDASASELGQATKPA